MPTMMIRDPRTGKFRRVQQPTATKPARKAAPMVVAAPRKRPVKKTKLAGFWGPLAGFGVASVTGALAGRGYAIPSLGPVSGNFVGVPIAIASSFGESRLWQVVADAALSLGAIGTYETCAALAMPKQQEEQQVAGGGWEQVSGGGWESVTGNWDDPDANQGTGAAPDIDNVNGGGWSGPNAPP